MTTENQIQVNLHKFKNGKQNFGAIEDAINEAKFETKNAVDRMKSIYDDLEQRLNSTLDAISGELELIGTDGRILALDFENELDAFNEINDELINNNIPESDFNLEVVTEMQNNLGALLETIDSLSRINMSNI